MGQTAELGSVTHTWNTQPQARARPLTLSHVEVWNVAPGAVPCQRDGSDPHRVVSWAEVGETDATLSPIRLPRYTLVLLTLRNQQKRWRLQAGAELTESPLLDVEGRKVHPSWLKHFNGLFI